MKRSEVFDVDVIVAVDVAVNVDVVVDVEFVVDVDQCLLTDWSWNFFPKVQNNV